VRLEASVPYSCAPRNVLDLYLSPAAHAAPKPLQNAPPTEAEVGVGTRTGPGHKAAEPVTSTKRWQEGTLQNGDRKRRRGRDGAAIARGDSAAAERGHGGAPVVIFAHGGVWATGERWHFTRLANSLAEAGAVVCVIAYSLYPAVSADCMVREVSDALSWTLDNIGGYGGDPHRVSVVGHSAGAHLALMALLHRARAHTSNAPGVVTGSADDGGLCTHDSRMPARVVLMAGPYDVAMHYEYEERRGVHMLSTMERAMGGWAGLRPRSPLAIIEHALHAASVAVLPVAGQGEREEEGVVAGGDVAARAAVASEAGDGRDMVGGGTSSAREGDGAGCVTGPHQERGAPSEPPHHLLNPPGRTLFYASFDLAGDAIAARASGRVNSSTAVAPPPFSTKAASAAERFAAAVRLEDVRLLPPLVLMHGTEDMTVPWYESLHMERLLHQAGVDVRLLLYRGVKHQDFVTGWPPACRDGTRSFNEDLYRLVA
jgi:acetyl esterase/lipase